MREVGIISYGCGNVKSIANMVRRVGGAPVICHIPEDIRNAARLILPGVGAFDHAVSELRINAWVQALEDAVLITRLPILGICLGMQVMCNASEEGRLPGLGWIDAEVKRLELPASSELKIPHMGWNTVEIAKTNPLISSEEGEQRFYFVHSYHAVCRHAEDVLATTCHGSIFAAAFNHENIYGVQFHPEKSHRFGMALMRRFVELPC